MNILHSRVDNRLLALSDHVRTLDENSQMRSDSFSVLFGYKSQQKYLFTKHVCARRPKPGNSGQCDDQESGHRRGDSSNPGRRKTSCRD